MHTDRRCRQEGKTKRVTARDRSKRQEARDKHRISFVHSLCDYMCLIFQYGIFVCCISFCWRTDFTRSNLFVLISCSLPYHERFFCVPPHRSKNNNKTIIIQHIFLHILVLASIQKKSIFKRALGRTVKNLIGNFEELDILLSIRKIKGLSMQWQFRI